MWMQAPCRDLAPGWIRGYTPEIARLLACTDPSLHTVSPSTLNRWLTILIHLITVLQMLSFAKECSIALFMQLLLSPCTPTTCKCTSTLKNVSKLHTLDGEGSSGPPLLFPGAQAEVAGCLFWRAGATAQSPK